MWRVVYSAPFLYLLLFKEAHIFFPCKTWAEVPIAIPPTKAYGDFSSKSLVVNYSNDGEISSRSHIHQLSVVYH